MGVEAGGGELAFGAFGRNFPGSQYEIPTPVFQTVINLTTKGCCYNYSFYTAVKNTREKAPTMPWFHMTHPFNNNMPSLSRFTED